MGFFDSKSSSTQNTTNNNTSVGVQGANNGFLTTGSNNRFNITQTDHGLVDAMADMSDSLFSTAGNMADGAFDAARSVSNGAFDYGRAVNADSLGFADGVVREFGDVTAQAFGFGTRAIDGNINLARDSIDAQNSLAEFAVGENSQLARDMGDLAQDSISQSLGFADGVFADANASIAQSNNNMMDLSQYAIGSGQNMAISLMHESSDLSRDFASGFGSLASDLSKDVIEQSAHANKVATDQIINAHKGALQFADNMSRSDGQQLALSSNKTMIFIVVGMVAVFGFAMYQSRG